MDPNLHSTPDPAARAVAPADPAAPSQARRGLPARFAAVFAGLRRHKKLCALLAVLALGGAALAGWRAFAQGPGGAALTAGQAGGDPGFSFTRTVTLERTTLENTVSATGTVESVNVSTVTTPLAYTVKTVEVQVGDVVEAGDVICTLDTAELERQIEQRQTAAARAVEKAQKALDEAQKSYDEAVQQQAEAEADEEEAEAAYRAAWDELGATMGKVSSFAAAHESAYAALQTALANYNAAYSGGYEAAAAAYEQAAARRAAAEAEYNAAAAEPDADPARLSELAQAAEAARAEEASALAARDAADTGAASAKAAYEAALAAEQQAQSALTEARRACNYDTLEAAKDTSVRAWESAQAARKTAESRVESAEKALAEARTALAEAGEDDELEQLRETLADCTLTAATSGTVTSLDATVGSKCSGTVATIQDTGALKVAFSLAEYEVGSVAVGMSAQVSSDASDEPVAGRLTQISPTTSAGSGAAGSGQSSASGFAAEVTLTGEPGGLRIGMNAKVELILSSAEDVFVVPYDAVGENEDGSKYVMARTGGEGAAFEPVAVTTGAENDYYIEIRGEGLAEGLEVRASAEEEAETLTGEEQAGEAGLPGGIVVAGDGGQGGMPGGMPGGGGMPSGGPGGWG